MQQEDAFPQSAAEQNVSDQDDAQQEQDIDQEADVQQETDQQHANQQNDDKQTTDQQDVKQQSDAEQSDDEQSDAEQTTEKQEVEEPLAAPDLWRAAALHLCELSAFILMFLGLQMRAWAWDWRFSVATAVASVVIYALCVVCVKRFFSVSKDTWSSYLQNLVIIVADGLIGELWLRVSGSAAFFALLWALLIIIRWAMYWRTGGHPSSKHAYFGTM